MTPELAQPHSSRSKWHRSSTPKSASSHRGNDQAYRNKHTQLVPSHWGWPPFGPTQFGLCTCGWVWSSLNISKTQRAIKTDGCQNGKVSDFLKLGILVPVWVSLLTALKGVSKRMGIKVASFLGFQKLTFWFRFILVPVWVPPRKNRGEAFSEWGFGKDSVGKAFSEEVRAIQWTAGHWNTEKLLSSSPFRDRDRGGQNVPNARGGGGTRPESCPSKAWTLDPPIEDFLESL